MQKRTPKHRWPISRRMALLNWRHCQQIDLFRWRLLSTVYCCREVGVAFRGLLGVANLPNRYSALCLRPLTHAQAWASYSALYRFGRFALGVLLAVWYLIMTAMSGTGGVVHFRTLVTLTLTLTLTLVHFRTTWEYEGIGLELRLGLWWLWCENGLHSPCGLQVCEILAHFFRSAYVAIFRVSIFDMFLLDTCIFMTADCCSNALHPWFS